MMKKKEITYPINATDGQGARYIFNKTAADKVEIVLPDGSKQRAEGDELAFIARAFKKHELKIVVGEKTFDVLWPTNKVLAYTVLYGKGSIIKIADTAGNVYESRAKFRFVNTGTYEAYTTLPDDREYVVEPILDTYTEGMHLDRRDDLTEKLE